MAWFARRRTPVQRFGNPLRVAASKNALTAAGQRVSRRDADLVRRVAQPWQTRSFAYYDLLGEIKYAAQFYSRALSQLRLYAAELDDDGELIETDDPTAKAALERIQDPGGGRSVLLANYGRLMFLTGEGLLFVSKDRTTGDEQWEMLSSDELRVMSGVYVRYKAPSLLAEEFHDPTDDPDDPRYWEPIDDNEAVVYRIWQRHPRYCADDQTEILSERGWVTHDALAPGVRVLTLNHETGQSEWQPVAAVNRFAVEDEPMISVEGAAHSSLTTVDHRWPTLHRRTATGEVEPYWTTSGALNSCDEIVTGAVCAETPTEPTFSDDFVEAVAWFYTEGSVARRYRSAQVSICQSDEANPGYVRRIRSALTGAFGDATTERMSTGSGPLAPPKWREYREPNRDHVYFWLNTAASAELLAVAPDRIVSADFIKALTREQLDLFVETSLAADGHGRLLAQKDPQRLAGFELACVLTGRTPHTYRLGSGMTVTNARGRGTCLVSPPGRPRRMQPRRTTYTGTVWCPTTRNGTWLARRHGTVYYTGNSMLADSTMQGVLDLCVAEGSMVNTLRGPVPIEEVLVGDRVFTWTAGGMESHAVVRHCLRGEQDVLKVTAGRRTLRATADHPVLRLTKTSPGKGYSAEYGLEWVDVGELAVGDHLVALSHLPDYGTPQVLPDGTPLTEDVAWLLGHIVGDGHVHENGLNIAVYDDARRKRIDDVVFAAWGLVDHPRGGNAHFYSVALRRTLARMGLRVYSHQRRVPKEVLAASAIIKRAFLSGYEEADGHLTKQGWQSLALSSGLLASELRALYLELGENVSNIHVQARAAVMAMPSGHTTENAKPLHRFQVYKDSVRRGKVNVLKTHAAREMVGDHFSVETVKAIEADGRVPTYDLEVSGIHNYLAEGLLVSNCEELVLLTQAVRARARSRMAGSGILFLDDRISPAPLEAAPDEDPEEDVFVSDLIETMTRPITDEGAASAVAPLVVRAPVPPEINDISKMVYHLQLVDPTQLYPETGLRYECIKRIAIGLDMPPEILLGIMDANHWTGWMIDEQSWKAHLQPKAQQLVDDLNSSYYRPMLREQGVKNWQKHYIAYDATAIINHPDRGKDAKDLYDRVAIGKKSLRDATGFGDDDAPDESERAEMIGVKVRDASLAWYGEPSVKAGGVETAPGEIIKAGTEGGLVEAPPDAADSGAEVEKGAPSGGPPEDDDSSGLRGAASAMLASRVMGACEMALLRAREAAGNRLLHLAKKDADLRLLLRDVPTRGVPAALGQANVRHLGVVSEAELVASARPLIVDVLRVFDVHDDAVVALIVEGVEKHAARTLYEPRPSPLPATFRNYVTGLLAGK